MKKHFIVILLFMTIIFLCACTEKNDVSNKLIIFHAGSLSMPFEAMEKEFEAMYPNIDVQREAGGSSAMARKISELNKPCDIMASADYRVIDKLLIPENAQINIRFASNQLVLCYTGGSRYSENITDENWYDILQKEDVVWGHSDPNLDPCGYRALMVMQLAEDFYREQGLYEKLLAGRPKENIRPKSVELISLLQTGHMDYAWEYLSVAIQHNLKYIKLPDAINLGNYSLNGIYENAFVSVAGNKPGDFMEIKGSSCTYGITLVRNAPNRKAAINFLSYLLDPKGGMKILKDMGQPPIIPAMVHDENMLKAAPEEIKKFLTANSR